MYYKNIQIFTGMGKTAIHIYQKKNAIIHENKLGGGLLYAIEYLPPFLTLPYLLWMILVRH